MTKQELNRAVKKLGKRILDYEDAGIAQMPGYIREEFDRLYMADQQFEYMTKNNILLMLRLNIRYQFIAFHRFGAKINILKLL